ncbi:MAG: MIP/aquaporin family protein [Bacteroidota bacterium]|nr:MIP/aquaporin family protein [Bacteroidota bacterium]
MTPFLSELLGTMFLIVLGDGVVANVVLSKTKGNGSGWIVISFGWAIAVFTGVYVATSGSGAHLNPAVTLAMAAFNNFPWNEVPTYLAGQMAGAMLGALIVWFSYRQHFDETTDPDLQLATFCTAPAIRNFKYNFLSELIGTFILVFGILFMTKPTNSIGTLDALPVGLLVLGIGLSLGGTTGYAINPARDLGPRIIHALLPMKNKGKSDWNYSWIPVFGPIAGGLLAAFFFTLLT